MFLKSFKAFTFLKATFESFVSFLKEKLMCIISKIMLYLHH